MTLLRDARAILLPVLALLVLLYGCGSGSGNNATRLNSQVATNPPVTPAFDLTITGPSVTILPNIPVIFTITISPTPGFNDNVRLNISGGNGIFLIQNPTPDTLALHGSTPVQASFTVSQVLGARAGSAATLTVTATTGVVTKTA